MLHYLLITKASRHTRIFYYYYAKCNIRSVASLQYLHCQLEKSTATQPQGSVKVTYDEIKEEFKN